MSPSPPEGPARGEGARTFEPAVAACLVALSNAAQKYAMYPRDHPALRTAAGAAFGPVQAALDEHPTLAIAVGARQLEVGGIESDPDHPRYGPLAAHLHRHQLAIVTFTRGLSEEELAGFLEAVGGDPEKGEAALGARPPERLPSWPHLQIQPLRFDRLGLAGGEGAASGAALEERASSLWTGLARAILVSEAVAEAAVEDPSDPGSFERPEDVARAVEEFSGRRAYSEAFVAHLGRVSRELRTLPEEAAAGPAGKQISRLVSLIEPQALDRLLREGTDRSGRRDLLADCSQWMEPEALTKLLRATAEIEDRELSEWLVLMLRKLAAHTTAASPAARSEARTTLRDQILGVLSDPAGGGGSHPTGGAWSGFGATAPGRAGQTSPMASGVEPERLIEIATAVDAPGPLVDAAVERMLEDGRLPALVAILDRAPSGSEVATALWAEVAGPDALERLLADADPDFDLLDRLLPQAGDAAMDPLLDALAAAESRTVRRKIYARLVAMGDPIGPRIVSRLDDDRWFVIRNLLAVMSELENWPPGWSPQRFGSHPHPAVRREALRMMVRVPASRERAICGLLEDDDPRALALGLAAAQKGAPPEAVPLLMGLLEDDRLEVDARAMAARALGTLGPPEAAGPLLRTVVRDDAWLSRLVGRLRLQPRSPLVLEALRTLRTHYSDDPKVRKALASAARSGDPALRAAARGREDR